MDSTPPDRARRRCRRLRRHFAGAGRLAVHDVVLLDQSETCGPSDLMPHQYEDQWPDTTIFRGNIGDRGLADDSFTDVQRPMEFEPRAGPHTAWQRDGRQEAAALGVRVGCDLRLTMSCSSTKARPAGPVISCLTNTKINGPTRLSFVETSAIVDLRTIASPMCNGRWNSNRAPAHIRRGSGTAWQGSPRRQAGRPAQADPWLT